MTDFVHSIKNQNDVQKDSCIIDLLTVTVFSFCQAMQVQIFVVNSADRRKTS